MSITHVARALVAAALPMLLPMQPTQQDPPALISMRDLSSHELRTQAFTLSAPRTLHIEAVGASDAREKNVFVRGQKDPGYWRGNAWILNARTRAVVWELRRANT